MTTTNGATPMPSVAGDSMTKKVVRWADPPAPSVFMEVTLTGAHALPRGPGGVTKCTFYLRSKATARKAAGLDLKALLYYVREAALRFAWFRAELDAMVAALPPSEQVDFERPYYHNVVLQRRCNVPAEWVFQRIDPGIWFELTCEKWYFSDDETAELHGPFPCHAETRIACDNYAAELG